MNRGFPSMTALLGLLAVAGYQNRDKLAELLGGGGTAPNSPRGPGQMPQQGGLDGLLGGAGGAGGAGLGGLLGGAGGAGLGGLLGGGLSELIERFQQSGHGDVAEFLGPAGAEQAGRAAPARRGDRNRRAGDAVAADRIVARGDSRPAFARAAGCGRQVYAGGPASERSRLRTLLSVRAPARG